MLRHVRWEEVEVEDLTPLFQRQMINTSNLTVARLKLKKGSVVPEHSHHNEQFSYVLEGSLKFVIDGRNVIVRGGEVLSIPSHMPHSAEALEDSIAVDIFHPVREDWVNKTDSYLREPAAKK